jgi:two-component system CheB/CheR fusion protein
VQQHATFERRTPAIFDRARPDELSVEGDKVKVRRIAQNLLNNALNYTESGGVKVEWRVDGTAGTARWSLCVEDTGPGVRDGL